MTWYQFGKGWRGHNGKRKKIQRANYAQWVDRETVCSVCSRFSWGMRAPFFHPIHPSHPNCNLNEPNKESLSTLFFFFLPCSLIFLLVLFTFSRSTPSSLSRFSLTFSLDQQIKTGAVFLWLSLAHNRCASDMHVDLPTLHALSIRPISAISTCLFFSYGVKEEPSAGKKTTWGWYRLNLLLSLSLFWFWAWLFRGTNWKGFDWLLSCFFGSWTRPSCSSDPLSLCFCVCFFPSPSPTWNWMSFCAHSVFLLARSFLLNEKTHTIMQWERKNKVQARMDMDMIKTGLQWTWQRTILPLATKLHAPTAKERKEKHQTKHHQFFFPSIVAHPLARLPSLRRISHDKLKKKLNAQEKKKENLAQHSMIFDWNDEFPSRRPINLV